MFGFNLTLTLSGYDSSVDCWAVGVLVYELLTGCIPFNSPNEEILFYKITENDIDFAAQVFVDTPEAVRALAYTRYCFVSGILCTNQYYSSRTHPLFRHPTPQHRPHYCAI